MIMKKLSVRAICFLVGIAVICLLSVSPAFSQDDGLSEALKAVERSTQKHIEVLTDLLDKVPEEARPAIEHAIAVSKRGRDTAVEAVELAQTPDPIEKALLHITRAERRLADIQAMHSKGKPEFIETIAEDYENAIGRAMEEINKARAQGRDVSKALKEVERCTKKHTEVLTALLGEVPEQARPAIEHAIRVSRRGRNHALDMLNETRRIRERDRARERLRERHRERERDRGRERHRGEWDRGRR